MNGEFAERRVLALLAEYALTTAFDLLQTCSYLCLPVRPRSVFTFANVVTHYHSLHFQYSSILD